jgi:F0F1-type ATP synthase membrane subunit c/vacuolar-type H+-ATPase subunit K
MNEMMKAKLRKLRLIQLALIAVIPIFGWVAEIGRGRGSSDWTLGDWLVTGVALWAALGGFRLRRRMIGRSEEALAKDASNTKALKQWEAGHVIGLAMAGSVVLWGLVVRMVLGGALWQASLFYAAGLLLLLLWTPRTPIATPAST